MKKLLIIVLAIGGSMIGAKDLPKGSYLATCIAAMKDSTLHAICLDKNKNRIYSELKNARDCEGDIENIDGNLSCGYIV